MDAPIISVIMPVHNGETFLREAIDSVLNQTFTDYEFIIIDDASKDTTADIIKSYTDPRINYIKNDNNFGVTRSLNIGLKLARGKYIARMDHDDVSLPERLETQAAFLNQHPEIVACNSFAY